MGGTDIVVRLNQDPGHRTIGELLQEREAALHEIVQLRSRLSVLQESRERLKLQMTPDASKVVGDDQLLTLRDVCDLIRISRSTVYKRITEGTFPPPIRLGTRTVRWQYIDISRWRSDL